MPPKKKKQIVEEEKKSPEKKSLRPKAPAAEEGSLKWNNKGSLIYGVSDGFKESKLIAGFDMDDTLIKTKSGKKFAMNASDWQFWDPSVPKKIKESASNGYSIVIFTNQAGISKGKTNSRDITKKIEMIQNELDVPMAALIASTDDEYRKPTTGMWKAFEEIFNKKVKVDLVNSIYCGDAAGRKDGGHKDFSDSDLKFARNIGIKFQTPENFFLGDTKQVKLTGFNPQSLKANKYIFKDDTNELNLKKKEMIIFCGSPASGKSTFWQNHLSTYERVNRDTLKTKEKCYKVAEGFMQQEKSVVIDNTSPTALDRKYFLDLAKKYDYTARCFLFEIPKDLSFHLDTQREVNKGRKHLSKRVGKIPIHSWFKNVEPPKKSEGFTDVKTVNFVPGPFANDQDEESFFSFVGK